MAQFARPNADTARGAWTNDTGGTSNIYQAIDEATAVDTDFIKSEDNPSNSDCKIGLSSVTDPVSSTGHIVRYRYRRFDTGGGSTPTINITVYLYEGATLRATGSTHAATTTWADGSFTLTSGEADSITNYSALHLTFRAHKASGARTSRGEISWAEFEVPGATFTATSALTGPGADINASASYTPPTFTGTSTLTGPGATISAAASVTNIFSATSALTGPGATISASASYTPPTFSATSALTGPGAVISGAASYTPPTFTGTSTLTGPGATVSASASYTAPEGRDVGKITQPRHGLTGRRYSSFAGRVSTFTGTSTLTGPGATISAAASYTPPTFTGTSVLTGPGATISASASYTPPTFTGTSTLTGPGAVVSAAASYTPPTFSATSALTGPGGQISAAASYTPPTFTGTSVLTGPGATISASATHVPPTVDATSALTGPSATMAASGNVVNIFSATSTLTGPGGQIAASASYIAPVVDATSTLTGPGATINASGNVVNIFSATSTLTGPGGQITAAASYTPPAVNATSALTGPGATVSATASTTPPSVDATSTLTGPGATVSASASTTPPTVDATSALTGPGATLYASASYTPPAVSATSTLTGPGATISASAGYVAPTFSATSTLTGPGPVISATADYVTPDRTATGALVGPGGQITATAFRFIPPRAAAAVRASLVLPTRLQPLMLLDGHTLVDPLRLAESCRQNRLSTDAFLGIANSYSTGTGSQPGRGYLLVTHATLRLLQNSHQPEHTLTISEFGRDAVNKVTLQKLRIVDETAIHPSYISSPGEGERTSTPQTVYLITVEDPRSLAATLHGNIAYNLLWDENQRVLRNPPGVANQEPSTLEEALTHLWSVSKDYVSNQSHPSLQGILGTLTRAGSGGRNTLPVNLRFHGTELWQAFHQLLLQGGFRLLPRYAHNQWRFFAQASAPASSELWDAFLKQRLVDLKANDPGIPLPEKVQLFYHAQDYQFWSDPQTFTGISRRATVPVGSITFTSNAFVPNAQITNQETHAVWSPVPAIYDDKQQIVERQTWMEAQQNFVYAYLERLAAVGSWQEYLFAGCYHDEIEPQLFTHIEWFDHGQGLFTRCRRLATDDPRPTCTGPSAAEPFSSPDLARTHLPQFRLLMGEVYDAPEDSLSPGYDPETGRQLTKAERHILQDKVCQVTVKYAQFGDPLPQPPTSLTWGDHTPIWAFNHLASGLKIGTRVVMYFDHQLAVGGQWLIIHPAETPDQILRPAMYALAQVEKRKWDSPGEDPTLHPDEDIFNFCQEEVKCCRLKYLSPHPYLQPWPTTQVDDPDDPDTNAPKIDCIDCLNPLHFYLYSGSKVLLFWDETSTRKWVEDKQEPGGGHYEPQPVKPVVVAVEQDCTRVLTNWEDRLGKCERDMGIRQTSVPHGIFYKKLFFQGNQVLHPTRFYYSRDACTVYMYWDKYCTWHRPALETGNMRVLTTTAIAEPCCPCQPCVCESIPDILTFNLRECNEDNPDDLHNCFGGPGAAVTLNFNKLTDAELAFYCNIDKSETPPGVGKGWKAYYTVPGPAVCNPIEGDDPDETWTIPSYQILLILCCAEDGPPTLNARIIQFTTPFTYNGEEYQMENSNDVEAAKQTADNWSCNPFYIKFLLDADLGSSFFNQTSNPSNDPNVLCNLAFGCSPKLGENSFDTAWICIETQDESGAAAPLAAIAWAPADMSDTQRRVQNEVGTSWNTADGLRWEFFKQPPPV